MIATASSRAEEEREPPAEVGGEERRVEQHADSAAPNAAPSQ